MSSESLNIWILVQHREGMIEEVTFGLLAEARRLLSDPGVRGTVSAVAMGFGLKKELDILRAYGADKVFYIESKSLIHYQGELFAMVLFRLAKRHGPSYIFLAQTPETADLCPRLAALMETGLVTRAMDFRVNDNGQARAVRPIANGYLFEEIHFDCQGPPIVSFLPSVLSAAEPDMRAETEILSEPVDVSEDDLKSKVQDIIEADQEELDLEEADIIVSGGRGVGRGEAFDIIHKLARTIGGSVSGTRPVIDWQILPFERQIGQTGKTVTPRLLITCGISGANEYTAGMEKSQLVIAINTDPRARIFRFADVGVVGDVHEILPALIKRIRGIKRNKGNV